MTVTQYLANTARFDSFREFSPPRPVIPGQMGADGWEWARPGLWLALKLHRGECRN